MEILKWPFIIISILGAFGVLYSWNSDSRGRSWSDFFTFHWVFESENLSGGFSPGVFTLFLMLVCVSLLLIYLELPESAKTWLQGLV